MYKIREIDASEIPFLSEMIRVAIFFPDLSKKDEILEEFDPMLSAYFDGFGRAGDHALVLETENGLDGAVWVRLYEEANRSYGFVDERTPELGIALREEWRDRGIGEQLINAMIDKLAREGFKQVSLSVDKRNRAMALYERMGFHIFSETDNSCTMLKTF
jgi:ribosomal protein S18 acetylase RimI-like enzyme